MGTRRCTKDDPSIPWLCSCDECAQKAAGSWCGLMDRVYAGDISLQEARTLDEKKG